MYLAAIYQLYSGIVLLGSLTIACLACHRIQVGVHIQCMGSIHYNCVYIVATVTCAQFAHVYIYGGAVLTG